MEASIERSVSKAKIIQAELKALDISLPRAERELAAKEATQLKVLLYYSES